MNYRHIKRQLALTVFSFCCIFSAFAREVISAELDRSNEGKAIVISALVEMAPQPNGKALFIFPGWPGIPRIELKDGTPFAALRRLFDRR